MKASEYIAKLEELISEHGDLEVDNYFPSGRGYAKEPEIKYRKILKGRESRASFWDSWEGEDKKGEKVISI